MTVVPLQLPAVNVLTAAHAFFFFLVHCSYKSRHNVLRECCQKAECRDIKPKLDHCGTRMAAVYHLLHSLAEVEKGIKLYRVDASQKLLMGGGCLDTDEDWTALRHIEAVLAIAHLLVLLSQTEKHFISALAPIIKNEVWKMLFADTIDVIDPGTITADRKTMRRTQTPVLDLCEVGLESLKRARIEFERRFCMNITDVQTGQKVHITEADALAILVDLRFAHRGGHYMTELGADATFKSGSIQVLKEAYVDVHKKYNQPPPSLDTGAMEQVDFGFGAMFDTNESGDNDRHIEEEFKRVFSNWCKLSVTIQPRMKAFIEERCKDAAGDSLAQCSARMRAMLEFSCASEYRMAEQNITSYGFMPQLARRWAFYFLCSFFFHFFFFWFHFHFYFF